MRKLRCSTRTAVRSGNQLQPVDLNSRWYRLGSTQCDETSPILAKSTSAIFDQKFGVLGTGCPSSPELMFLNRSVTYQPVAFRYIATAWLEVPGGLKFWGYAVSKSEGVLGIAAQDRD